MIKNPSRETVRMCATTCAPLKGGGASGAVAQTPHFAASAPPCDTSDFEVAQSEMRHHRATQRGCATSKEPSGTKNGVSEGPKQAENHTLKAGDMIPAADQWGPFRLDLDPAERLARLRSMRAIVRLSTGPRGERLADELQRAERDASRLPFALAALDRLAPLDRRQVLSSFAQLHRHA